MKLSSYNTDIIYAAIVLHNICQNRKLPLPLDIDIDKVIERRDGNNDSYLQVIHPSLIHQPIHRP